MRTLRKAKAPLLLREEATGAFAVSDGIGFGSTLCRNKFAPTSAIYLRKALVGAGSAAFVRNQNVSPR